MFVTYLPVGLPLYVPYVTPLTHSFSFKFSRKITENFVRALAHFVASMCVLLYEFTRRLFSICSVIVSFLNNEDKEAAVCFGNWMGIIQL